MSADTVSPPNPATPTVVHLDAEEVRWGEHTIAGAELPAVMTMLRMDPARGTRVAVVKFPDGWRRDATGNQPAGEEMVVLSGELSISGLRIGTGQMLIASPFATRAATTVLDGTSALVWFSGPGGGWSEGEAATPGAAAVHVVDESLSRPPVEGLVGSIEARSDAAGATFTDDVDLYWPAARTWAFVPAGAPAPGVDGLAIVHHWG